MPTITLQVGQAGNQLGATFWRQLQQQQEVCSSSLLAHEWFASSTPAAAGDTAQPRCICVDSDAKVVQRWRQTDSNAAKGSVHVLRHGRGCGNNWSCGYSMALSASSHNKQCSWAVSDDQLRCVDQVMEGIRLQAERDAGVPDFLLLCSLAGGTGSGFGSALLEVLADEFPCSTVAAAAVAPGRAGGSDTVTQSINCCLALQHLSEYAHAVLLFDNQVLLDKLNSSSSSRGRTAGSSALTSAAGGSSSSGRRITGSSSSSGRAAAAVAGQAPVSGRACLQGCNELAAETLLGLLWPLSEQDTMARRSSIQQLVSSVAADPLTKLLEVAHVADPDAQLPVNMMDNPWPARIKLLASQLPTYDPWHPTQPVTTSAALLVARGGLCSQKPCNAPKAIARTTVQRLQSLQLSTAGTGGSSGSNGSCWVSAGRALDALGGSSGGSSGGWQAAAALSAVGSSWPRWAGGSWDVQLGDSLLPVWSAAAGTCTSSLTAAVRRSSTGSFLRDVAGKCRRLCEAGAYMHWYQQYGTQVADILEASDTVSELAEGYCVRAL